MNDPDFDFGEIVAAAVDASTQNPFALEKAGGLPADAIRSVIRKDSKRAIPRITRAKEICDLLGLEFYIGPPRDIASSPVQTLDEAALEGHDFAVIDQVAAEAAAGDGRENGTGDEVIGGLAFRRDWLKKIGVNPAAAKLIRASGDSMHPIIKDKDLLLVDTQRKTIMKKNVFAFVDADGMTRVKRLERVGDTLLLQSEAKGVETEIRRGADAKAVKVIGQVVWSATTWG